MSWSAAVRRLLIQVCCVALHEEGGQLRGVDVGVLMGPKVVLQQLQPPDEPLRRLSWEHTTKALQQVTQPFGIPAQIVHLCGG